MEKVVLVTGSARGIGRAIAEAFAADHTVAITYLTTEPAGLDPTILAIKADLTAPKAAEEAVRKVIERFGRLDIIVNNAGLVVASPQQGADPQALVRMLQVNLLAADALLRAALPHLKAGATVVNISSVNAVLPPNGAAIYGASKAALELWSRGMAKELGPRGIRVNAVAPGAVSDPRNPRTPELVELFVKDTALGRIATPDDIARAVRFLAGEEASFITGEVLTVSGGYRL
jgi:3-oxoacyl-[acyl-carrier protein] reductase